MDIEKIEKILTGVLTVIEQAEEDVSAATAMPFIECQLLLHIYRKLEAIEEQLGGIGRNMWDK